MASDDSLFRMIGFYLCVARDLSPVHVLSLACAHDRVKVMVLAIPRQNLEVQIEGERSHLHLNGQTTTTLTLEWSINGPAELQALSYSVTTN
jgi:hypothetical protein